MKRLTLMVIVWVVFLVTGCCRGKVKKLAGGMEFTEGPVWLPDEGILVFSDIPNSKLMQWREGDGLSLFRQSAHSNGNILDLQGQLISCQHSTRNIVRTEPDGSITVLVDNSRASGSIPPTTQLYAPMEPSGSPIHRGGFGK